MRSQVQMTVMPSSRIPVCRQIAGQITGGDEGPRPALRQTFDDDRTALIVESVEMRRDG